MSALTINVQPKLPGQPGTNVNVNDNSTNDGNSESTKHTSAAIASDADLAAENARLQERLVQANAELANLRSPRQMTLPSLAVKLDALTDRQTARLEERFGELLGNVPHVPTPHGTKQLWSSPQLPRLASWDATCNKHRLPLHSIFIVSESAVLCFGRCCGSFVKYGAQLMTALLGLSFPLGRALAQNATELQWCSDMLFCAGLCSLSMLASDAGKAFTEELSLNLTTRGRLKDAAAMVSDNSKDLLVRWLIPLSISALLFFVGGCVIAFQVVVFQPGDSSWFSNRPITEFYAYSTMALAAPVVAFWFPLGVVWVYAFQCAAIMAGAQVKVITAAAQNIAVDDPRWRVEVAQGVCNLVNTLRLLSDTFGPTFGYLAVSGGLLALAFCSMSLETKAIGPLILAASVVVPLCSIAWAGAQTSTWCRELRFIINDKRTEQLTSMTLAKARELEEMEKALQQQNQGQGLGFTVWTLLIDVRLLTLVLTGCLSAVASVVPVMFALQEKVNGVPCALSDEHKAAFQTTGALINASCTFKLTVGPSGVISHPI